MFEFFSHPIPAVIILLGVLVFVHEFGHFIVGRLCGIATETFSIGFGPKILSFTRKGTEYRISWIPLGGYVKFAGSHPSEKVPEHLPGVGFLQVATWKRALTILAGPLANFVLAFVVYAGLGYIGIDHPPAQIGIVAHQSPAETAGLLPGDRVVAVNAKEIRKWRDLEKAISSSPGQSLELQVKRQDSIHTLTLVPQEIEAKDLFGRAVKIGRAGIALGDLTPAIAVKGEDSLAARLGIMSGDIVVAYTLNDQKHEINTYFSFLKSLSQFLSQSTDNEIFYSIHRNDGDANNEFQTLRISKKELQSAVAASDYNLAENSGITPLTLQEALGIRDAQMVIEKVEAPAVGVLQKGDQITAIEGNRVLDIFELDKILRKHQKPKLAFTIIRNHQDLTIDVPMKSIDLQKPEGRVEAFTLPLTFLGKLKEPEVVVEKYDSLLSAVSFGLTETYQQTVLLGESVANLFSGQIPLQSLGGPILIAKVAGDSARHGLQTFLFSMALISINLGLLNLLPIPVLDGGQLILVGAEAVLRRPLQPTAVENFQKLGVAFVLALVVLATYNDISRFWKSMLHSVTSAFQ